MFRDIKEIRKTEVPKLYDLFVTAVIFFPLLAKIFFSGNVFFYLIEKFNCKMQKIQSLNKLV